MNHDHQLQRTQKTQQQHQQQRKHMKDQHQRDQAAQNQLQQRHHFQLHRLNPKPPTRAHGGRAAAAAACPSESPPPTEAADGQLLRQMEHTKQLAVAHAAIAVPCSIIMTSCNLCNPHVPACQAEECLNIARRAHVALLTCPHATPSPPPLQLPSIAALARDTAAPAAATPPTSCLSDPPHQAVAARVQYWELKILDEGVVSDEVAAGAQQKHAVAQVW